MISTEVSSVCCAIFDILYLRIQFKDYHGANID